jgi:hypothetical protein
MGELPAFAFAWTNVTVTRPGSTAIITTIFAEYLSRLIFYTEHTVSSEIPHLEILKKFIAM